MKVNASSWHYRLWKMGRHYRSEPRDLCRYFWHLALVKVLAPLTVLLLALGGVIWLLYLIVKNPLVSALTVGGILLGAALILGVGVLIGNYLDRREARVDHERWNPSPPKEPGVLKQYLKARKAKFCPLIEVVKDGKTS